MTSKDISKAKKLYNMHVDNAASVNEKDKAKRSLIDILKRNKASLTDFIDNVQNASDFNFKEVKTLERSYKLSDNTRKKSDNKLSRRKLVINMLKENKFSKREIATILTETHAIADFKNNMKCVSGTMYDLQSHNVADFKTDSKTDKIVSVFA